MKAWLGDIEVAYTIMGDGPQVVLIHGLAEGKESWAGVQQRLTDFCTHAYDFRGHGETTLGQGNGTLEQLGGDLIAFLEQVTGPVQCVGYSLGGTIVLWAAAQRPDLVTAAVVTGTSTVVGRQAVGFFEERIRMIKEDFSDFAPALQQDTALQIVTSGVDLEEVTARRLKDVGAGGGYINAAQAMMRLHENPLTPLLSKIQCPVSVIGGAEDVFCPRKAADIMLAELNNGTFQEVAHAGHLLSVDQPQAYATAIHTALQRKTDG
jgi:pimeloyl-ACP methyl ester carboxylesterase